MLNLYSCYNSHKEVKELSENTEIEKEILIIDTENRNDIKKTNNNLCIDTILLNEMNIKHSSLIESNIEVWQLEYTKYYNEDNFKSISYIYSCEFNPKNCKEKINWFQLDSIKIQLSKTDIQMIIIDKFLSSSNLNNLNKPNSKLVDINFDGIQDFDLGLNEVSGVTNELRKYFIFNPNKARFEGGIDLANLGIDTENKILYSSWSGGHAGRIGTRIWSNIFEYDSLRTEKSIHNEYDKKLDSYIIETVKLNSEEEYETTIDTVKRKQYKR